MGKNRKQASLTNVVQYDSNFNLSIGSSTSSSFNSSGSIIAASGFTGSLSGSVFGLGNKQYEHYNAMGKATNKFLEKLGGNTRDRLCTYLTHSNH